MRRVREHLDNFLEGNSADLQPLRGVLAVDLGVPVLGGVLEALIRVGQPVVHPPILRRVELRLVDSDSGERQAEHGQHDEPVELRQESVLVSDLKTVRSLTRR